MIATPLPDRPHSPPCGGDRDPCVRLHAGVLRRSSAQSCLRPLSCLFWPFTARAEPTFHARSAADREARSRGQRPGNRAPGLPRAHRDEPRRYASLPPGIDPQFSSGNLPGKMHDDVGIREFLSCLFYDPFDFDRRHTRVRVLRRTGCVNPLPNFFRVFFAGDFAGPLPDVGGRHGGLMRARRRGVPACGPPTPWAIASAVLPWQTGRRCWRMSWPAARAGPGRRGLPQSL